MQLAVNFCCHAIAFVFIAPSVIAQVSPSLAISSDQARESMQWLVDVAAQHMPHEYEGDDDWGKTKRVWAGVHIRREGLELKTHRRFKDVRHGRWVKYQLKLPLLFVSDANPIQIQSVEATDNGRWRITTSVAAPLDFTCRIEQWNLGLQWYSVSVEGNMRVRLNCVATLAMHADYSEVPPAIFIDPQVESAELVLEHFEVNRISKLGGDVAEELGDVVEKVLQDKWLDKENARLPDRLNKSIAKKREQLRFSMSDWITKWQQ